MEYETFFIGTFNQIINTICSSLPFSLFHSISSLKYTLKKNNNNENHGKQFYHDSIKKSKFEQQQNER